MIPMTLREVAAATGAEMHGDAPEAVVTSVEFDSRTVRPGALFVALTGEHADGHDFAAAAAAAGAVAVLGTRPVDALPTLVAPRAETLHTETAAAGTPGDPVLDAMSALAHEVAGRLVAAGLTIVGVTGSAGKTSTKDMIAAVLTRAGAVVAPPESFNNELGHPYTVLRADRDTRFLVLELSARGIGHIAKLARIATPRIGAVLNVGSAHLGEFGSQDAIAVAKGELVEALPGAADGGVAILNADDPRVIGMAPRTRARVVTTGVDASADVRAVDVTVDSAARAAYTLVTPEGSAPVHLAVVGAHQVANSLAAAAVARAVGMDVDAIATALSEAGPASKWRMAVSDVAGVTIVNDAYNANPESMRAALTALEQMIVPGTRWAVLGEMAELGDGAPRAHRGVGEFARAHGARVVAIGDRAREITAGAQDSLWYPDIPTAVTALAPLIRPGDAVLVKASRAVGLERFAAALAQTLPSVAADAPSATHGTVGDA